MTNLLRSKLKLGVNYICSCLSVHKKPLPEPQELKTVKKTLVLDLDETLVHSSFVQVEDPDLKFDVNNIYIID